MYAFAFGEETKKFVPFQLKIPVKRRLDFQRLLGLHLKLNHRACFVDRHKKSFAYAERVPAVDERRRFRPRFDRPHQRLGGNCPAFGMNNQMKVAEQFKRVSPRFHSAGFVSENAGAFPDRNQKLPWPRGARDLEPPLAWRLFFLRGVL